MRYAVACCRIAARAKFCAVVALWLVYGSAHATTYTVINSNDSGAGSLRQALLDANAHAGADTIGFAIPGGVVHTIAPLTALPTITSPVTINGYTQAGSSANTSAIGTNAVLTIELSGASATAGAIGLDLGTNSFPSTIRGLAINRFRVGSGGNNKGTAIRFAPASSGGTVAGCFVGTDVSGSAAAKNEAFGVLVLDAAGVQVGGTALADRNVISGNHLHGVTLDTDGNTVQGNLIGVAADGRVAMGNGLHGVAIFRGSDNLIGGTTSGAGNVIAGNAGGGVAVLGGGSGNTIEGNSLGGNAQLGIDLSAGTSSFADGATANDSGDADSGSNNLQNFPLFSRAEAGGGVFFVSGSLNSTPSRTFRIEFFASDSVDASGFGEGQTLIGSVDRTTNPSGNVSFSLLGAAPVTTRQYVTATATDTVTGDTSEFSPAIVVTSSTTVSNRNDSGPGSLRDAILFANSHLGPDVIDFAIPGSGVHVISPLTPLPTITDPLTIDGYTQLGALPNTLADASNAVLKIQIDGANFFTQVALLSVCAPSSLIRGLAVTNASYIGIGFGFVSTTTTCAAGSADGSQLAGSFIGLDPAGTANGGALLGVDVHGSAVLIGGIRPSERNVISANGTMGVAISGGDGGAVIGNLIGWSPDGTAARGNGYYGVMLASDADLALIGDASAPNRIGNNQVGIVVSGANSTDNTLLANSIGPNSFIGIDLFPTSSGDGVTANDVNDADAGANKLQNFPVPNAITRTATGLHINAGLDRPSGAVALSYTIGVYANEACDTSGHGEGTTFLGSFAFNSPNGSTETIDTDFDTTMEVPIGASISLTATDANGSTSEFSLCAPVDPMAQTYTVNTTADIDDGICTAGPGGCTLRDAINTANAHAGGDKIGFAIPGAAVQIIAPASALPTITEAVSIDGYTQQGAMPNTTAEGDNAVILIQIDGSGSSSGIGLDVCASNTTVRGLSMTRWVSAIALARTILCGTLGGIRIEGNFLGLSPDGNAAGNTGYAVDVDGAAARIGGTLPAERNVVSANGTVTSTAVGAIHVTGNGSTGTAILGNYIGTDPSGALTRGNLREGISSSSGGIVIGGAAPNRIAFNRTGVAMLGSTGTTLLGNEIFSNSALAIDLIASGSSLDGVTPNDANDADAGPNGLQNFPVLSQTEEIGGQLVVAGSLDVPAATSGAAYQIDVSWSPACDASGFGEGRVRLGTGTVVLSDNAEGFHFALPVQLVSGGVITATATSPGGGTSEFSACSTLFAPPNAIFSDSFDL